MKTDTSSSSLSAAAPPGNSAAAQLREHGLQPKQSLGQNFLSDPQLCARIAELCPTPAVVEIGAGLGALTGALLERGRRVVAVETDRRLTPLLRQRFAAALGSGQLRLLEQDARKLDWVSVFDSLPAPRTLAGNLPYHLSGLLLRQAVDHAAWLEHSVFLLQREVVARLVASPGTAAYGALSVFVQSVYLPRRAFSISRGAFFPQPKVDSAVVELVAQESPETQLLAPFPELVQRAFSQRRKTLRNAWRNAAGFSDEQLRLLAERAQIDLAARGETLSVADFQRAAAEFRVLLGAGSATGGEPREPTEDRRG